MSWEDLSDEERAEVRADFTAGLVAAGVGILVFVILVLAGAISP